MIVMRTPATRDCKRVPTGFLNFSEEAINKGIRVRRGDRDQALKKVIERDPTLTAAETIVAKAILVSISL